MSREVLLVVGLSGYAGDALRRNSVYSRWAVVGASRRTGLDITDRAAVVSRFASVRPAAVINVAAALGNAGGPAQASWPVNVRGAAHVAAAAAVVGARLVHVSSDAVHAGRPEPYTEADDPSPVFPYGAAKAAAEAAVSAVCPDAVLARTSLIVSDGVAPLSRHEQTALAMTRGEAPGALFVDEIRCPVPVGGLAAALLALAGSDLTGVVNVAGLTPMSRHELGIRTALRNGLDPSRVPAGKLSDSALTRPAKIHLDSGYLLSHFPDLEPHLTLPR
ncbi:sugar nucleotide-binding protein [Virgisporangium aurantiacum]|uniref:NAD(P)-dependent oxidoreductase n=1 Tax=Virgisporangium aurantiacum TaxID=175570 RepID=A0A8J4E3P1_9ACTN|nr:sugar nucleotide-binding protein [Virgisporangium aurantiacum]GIJ58182.1 NAD(P)-dependent oxidoreductase [Virgisporangium aurantiacum]